LASWGSFTNREVQHLQASPSASWETEVAALPLRVVAGTDLSAAFLGVKSYSEKARTTKTNSFDVSQVSVGPFLTARLYLPNNLTLEGGARYDRSTIAAENADKSVDDSKTHEAFVYDAGVVYRPGRATKVYARFGTVFRYPFTDEQASLYGYGSDVFLTDLDAEKGYNLEAGLSASLGRMIRLDASAYLMRLEDEVAWFATGAYTGYNANLDKTRRIGADLTVEATPRRFLSVRGTYGWVDAEFENGDDEGNAVPLVPAHKLDAEVTLRAPFGLSVAPGVSYRSESYQGGDTANASETIDAYAVYALTVRFVPVALSGKLELTAKAENLLDNEYAPYVLDGGYYYPAAGRSFSLGVSYRY
jgi:iron complex outermembrane receptor protein